MDLVIDHRAHQLIGVAFITGQSWQRCSHGQNNGSETQPLQAPVHAIFDSKSPLAVVAGPKIYSGSAMGPRSGYSRSRLAGARTLPLENMCFNSRALTAALPL